MKTSPIVLAALFGMASAKNTYKLQNIPGFADSDPTYKYDCTDDLSCGDNTEICCGTATGIDGNICMPRMWDGYTVSYSNGNMYTASCNTDGMSACATDDDCGDSTTYCCSYAWTDGWAFGKAMKTVGRQCLMREYSPYYTYGFVGSSMGQALWSCDNFWEYDEDEMKEFKDEMEAAMMEEKGSMAEMEEEGDEMADADMDEEMTEEEMDEYDDMSMADWLACETDEDCGMWGCCGSTNVYGDTDMMNVCLQKRLDGMTASAVVNLNATLDASAYYITCNVEQQPNCVTSADCYSDVEDYACAAVYWYIYKDDDTTGYVEGNVCVPSTLCGSTRAVMMAFTMGIADITC